MIKSSCFKHLSKIFTVCQLLLATSASTALAHEFDVIPTDNQDKHFDVTSSENTKPFQEVSDVITVKQGISARDFSWAISASGSNSNTLSELRYDNLELSTTEIDLNLYRLFQQPESHWKTSGTLVYGKVKSGLLSDTDYSASSSVVTHQSYADLEGSKSFSIELEIARDLSYQDNGSLEVSTGIQWHSDKFIQRNGVQTVSNGATLEQPNSIHGLNSSYKSHWFGPFIGISKKLNTEMQSFTLGTKLFAQMYYGEGQWNLRQDLAQPKSFEHNAFGAGLTFMGQHTIRISNNFSIQQSAQLAYNSTFNGQDQVYKADGTSSETQLKSVMRTSISYNIGVVWDIN